MLDSYFDQGSGLRKLGLGTSPRLLMLACNQQPRIELSLLWSMCIHLEAMRHRIVVLDGTTWESDENPGLHDVLNDNVSLDELHGTAQSWLVMPSAKGLQLLGAPAGHEAQGPMAWLGKKLAGFDLVIVHALGRQLAPLVQQTRGRPLFVVAPEVKSVMQIYQSIKQLLMGCGVTPRIAAYCGDTDTASAAEMARMLAGIQHCAQTYLGHPVDTYQVAASSDATAHARNVQLLLTHLLECAPPLCPPSGKRRVIREATASHQPSGMRGTM